MCWKVVIERAQQGCLRNDAIHVLHIAHSRREIRIDFQLFDFSGDYALLEVELHLL